MTSELKQRVMEIVGGKPANIYTIKKVILLVLEYKGEVSSDDIRFYVKAFDPSSKVIGTAFMDLIRERRIEKFDTKKTDLASSKGRPIAVYREAQD